MKKLRVHVKEPEFNLRLHKLALIFKELETIIDEFDGLKKKVIYVDDFDDIVAEKTYRFVYNGQWEELVVIEFYDTDGYIVDSATVRTSNVYNSEKQSNTQRSCVKTVYNRLLFDIENEINENRKNVILGDFSQEIKDIYLEAILEFEQGVDYLFKVVMKDQVDTLINRGRTEDLYQAILEFDSELLNTVATTSEIGATYKEICLRKFNPINFDYFKID